jgi:hypothetical protein
MLRTLCLRAAIVTALIVSALVLTPAPVRAIAPGAPTSLSASVDGPEVTLSWAASANGPTHYVVLAGLFPGDTIVSLPVTADATSLSVVAPPGTYFVRVVAVNADGPSPPSNEIVVNVGCQPATPRNFRVMQKDAEAFLFWNPASGATMYALQAGFTPGAVDLQFVLPANTFNVLVPPGTYYARVVPVNGCGAGNASQEIVVTSPSNSVRVADPDPGTLLSFPDIAQLVARFASQNRPTIANTCPTGRKYEPNPWQNALVDFLRTYDTRFGYNAKPTKDEDENNGFPVIAAGDEIAYYRGSGSPMEGSPLVFAIDVLGNHCGTTDPTIVFRDIAPEPAIWTSAGRFPGDER